MQIHFISLLNHLLIGQGVEKKNGFIIITALFLFFINGPSLAIDKCEPKNRWVETCGADTDDISVSEATLSLDQGCDGSSDSQITLSGPVKIRRGDPQDILDHSVFGNLGNVDNHKDVIETEIVSMTLTNGQYTLRAGDGTGNLSNDGALYSPGHILENTRDSTKAESLFHLFFEIDTPNGTFHNQQALIMRATITKAPPLNRYISNKLAELYDTSDQRAGCILPGAGHVLKMAEPPPPPPPGAPISSKWGLIIFTLLLLTFGTFFVIRRQTLTKFK